MSQTEDPSSTENSFRGRLTRKALWVVVPAILLPVITAVIGGSLLPGQYPSGRVSTIILILFINGLIISFLFDWFLTRQIIHPLQEITATVSRINAGDFSKVADDRRKDEFGLLAHNLNQVGDKFQNNYQLLENVIEAQRKLIQTAAELSETAASSRDVDQLLQHLVDLIVNNFSHFHAAIYILDQSGLKASLRAIAGETRNTQIKNVPKVDVDPFSIVGWCAKYNQTRIAINVDRDPLYKPLPNLPEIQSEIAIPISLWGKVLGVLDIRDTDFDAFEEAEITTLQIIANQVASTFQNMYKLENDPVDSQASSILYQSSHRIILAQTVEAVLNGVEHTIQQLPYSAALYMAEYDHFQGVFITDRDGQDSQDEKLFFLKVHPLAIAESLPDTFPILLPSPQEFNKLPDPLRNVCLKLKYNFLILFPFHVNKKLTGLLFIGAVKQDYLTFNEINFLTNLVEITTTSLEKISALQTITDRLTELQTLKTVSQSISTEINLTKLYEVIHQQIIQVMGPVNFLIALYSEATSTIEIPYMEDGTEIVHVPPFPLGEGLTSIIIRTRQPLMIVEDTANRSRALGAIVTGENPALSWLGVPMILAGDIIGAIVVQDLEQEHRFDEDDMRLLTTLAAQVAIAVNSTRLIEISQKRVERDRKIFEITDKIRHSAGVQDILQTTIQELGKALGVRRAHISISTEASSQPVSENGGKHRELDPE
ncbi:MAG: GAF domain-containing protein [Anaerolineales bacterium]|nr:GAF domain-containing protein [Anaerolineales bacterium]